MGRVVVAIAEGTHELQPLIEALELLGREHDYVFLCVEPGTVPALIAEGGVGGATVLTDTRTWVEAETAARATGSAHLAELVKDLPVTGRIRVETGDPGERICAVAAEEKADLVVMGATHAGAIRRLIGGSVGDDVTHHAPCPVLVTRNKDTRGSAAR